MKKIRGYAMYGLMSLTPIFLQMTHALEWHDTSVGVSWGNKYREPENSKDVTKTILNLTHVSGDKLGNNLFVADLLLSTKSDPSKSNHGATEVYMFYKRAFSLSALTGEQLGNSLFKDWYINARFDIGRKNSALAPRPKKIRIGVSTDLAVPVGFVNIGVDYYRERSHNGITHKSFNFDSTYAIWGSWSIPISSKGSIEGIVDHIGAMGKDGFGVGTKPSTLFRLNYLHDIGEEGGFKLGLGYQYWRNKYGNDNRKDSKRGSTENAYTLQLRYQF